MTDEYRWDSYCYERRVSIESPADIAQARTDLYSKVQARLEALCWDAEIELDYIAGVPSVCVRFEGRSAGDMATAQQFDADVSADLDGLGYSKVTTIHVSGCAKAAGGTAASMIVNDQRLRTIWSETQPTARCNAWAALTVT